MKVEIKGDKELSKTLNELGPKLFTQVIRRANTEAMKPVSQAMKKNARSLDIPASQAKDLAKAIGRRTKVYKKDGVVVTVVGPRVFSEYTDSKGGKHRIPYLQIEFGDVTKDGTKIVAQPYARPAWDGLKASVEASYARSVAIGLKKIAEREAKRSRK